MAEVFELRDIYIPDGVARHNYVEREEPLRRLRQAIDSYGMQFVLSGIKHVGKTTMVVRELENAFGDCLHTPCQVGDDWKTLVNRALDLGRERLSARAFWERWRLGRLSILGLSVELRDKRDERQYDPQRLAVFLSRLRLPWVIDDCQRLTQEGQAGLPDLLRVFQQVGAHLQRREAKVFIISTDPLFKSLLSARSDLKNRIVIGHLDPMSEDDLERIIEQGAQRLNLSFSKEVVREILFLSGGSPLACHALCRRICHLRSVQRTAAKTVEITRGDLEAAIRDLAKESDLVLAAELDKANACATVVTGLTARQVLNELSRGDRGMDIDDLLSALQGFCPTLSRENLIAVLQLLGRDEAGGLVSVDVESGAVRFSDPLALHWIRLDLEKAAGRRAQERFADAIVAILRDATG